jgi:lysophospholipase L1-like esterase
MKNFVRSKAGRRVITAVAVVMSISAIGVSTASAATRAPSPHVIVGMGDSFTSGEGVPPFMPGTDTATDSCHRSYLAYPNVAGLNSLRLARNVACSGAVTDDLFRTNKTEASQVSRLKGATDIVLTIGGNDINALGAISQPPTPQEFAAKLAVLAPKLVQTYQRIHVAAPNATIHVLGYPYLFSASSQPECVVNDATRTFLLQAQAGLNATIKGAAAAAGVQYIDDSAAFAGHEVCTSHPWVNSIDQQNPRYSFHPNVFGQIALGKQVAQAL